MKFRGFIALAVAIVAVAAAPAVAGAQSAGDDQYVDPLSGVTGDGSSNGSGGGSESGTAGTAGSGSSASSGSTSQLPGELARTGADLPLTAGAGLLLLVGGLGLRRFSVVRS